MSFVSLQRILYRLRHFVAWKSLTCLLNMPSVSMSLLRVLVPSRGVLPVKFSYAHFLIHWSINSAGTSVNTCTATNPMIGLDIVNIPALWSNSQITRLSSQWRQIYTLNPESNLRQEPYELYKHKATVSSSTRQVDTEKVLCLRLAQDIRSVCLTRSPC